MSDYGLWLPKGASTFAAEIDSMINLVHWLMGTMLVGWGIFFIYFLIKFRARSGHTASQRSFHPNWLPAAMIVVVMGWDAYMLVGHDIPFWHRLKTDTPSEEESTVVRVVAQQFAWNIHYPGADGFFGRTDLSLVDEKANPIGLDFDDPAAQDDITTVGQLRLPVDKPVIVHLTTKDVIHSFSLPVMRVKKDAIPGMSLPTWFIPTRTGNWQIACAQLCGNSHFNMKGLLIVQTREKFDAWLAEKAAELGEAGEEVW